MYVTEIKEKQIFERIRWQLRIFESVFYKSLIRACSFGNFLAASQNARSNGQTSNHRHCEFVKNALKKCSCLPPEFFQIFVFLLFLSHTPEVYSNHHTVCMFYCIGIYNKHCLSLQKLKTDNTQHTHPLKFSNLVIVHTLDFRYMIKNK